MLLAAVTFPGGTPGELASFLSRQAGNVPVVVAPIDPAAKMRVAKVSATTPGPLKRESASYFGLSARAGDRLALGPVDLPASAFPGLPKPGEAAEVGTARPQTLPGGRPAGGRSRGGRFDPERGAARPPRAGGNAGLTLGSLTTQGEKVSVEGTLVLGRELERLGARPDWMVANIPVAIAAKDASPAELRAVWAEALGAIDDNEGFRIDPKTLPNRALATWRGAGRKAPGVAGALVLAAADVLGTMPPADLLKFFSTGDGQEDVVTRPGTPRHDALFRTLVAAGAANYPTPDGPLGSVVNPLGPARLRIKSDGTVTATLTSLRGTPIDLQALRSPGESRFREAIAGVTLTPTAFVATGREPVISARSHRLLDSGDRP